MKAMNLNHLHPMGAATQTSPGMDTKLVTTRFQWPDTPVEWARTIREAPYRSYLYSYPHKTAYRSFDTPLSLQELWEKEELESYFLYMHIPFCAARCGFCNLFTLPDKRQDVHKEYVDALERQARQWAPIMGGRPFSRFAIGGGTPTLLEAPLVERLFDIAENIMGLDPKRASISVETSPDTVTEDRLEVLKRRGTDRVSMGIQSFVESESAAIYRPQKPKLVRDALERLVEYNFPLLNVDLIYGLPGQTVETWLYSLEEALSYSPGEIFLYPLYIRENTILKPGYTGLDHDIRLSLYEVARERLKQAGYVQYSMRRFAKNEGTSSKELLPYSCQEESMAGLGCGARSYTRDVHYASRYGVSTAATRSIIADYVAAERHDLADYGFILNADERKRRFILKALLHREGLELCAYAERFGVSLEDDFTGMSLLLESGMAVVEEGTLRLTEEGMAYSDAIGDWMISTSVRERMEGYVGA
ncbi:STM4012 family radical SAM protein [Paenibacillus polymyxa]|uniref:STM4012 family radical SAM protein n=1 Tax=Paenibacillus polymyxa TaxID=1406 RepID=UPI0017847824|nr:STM4012 family radical SAM protein [Paenibacillus polymyxa]QOH62485.1 coproporphyrinogen III oxidase family protein [Paenibacillus polymyxa]